MTLFRILLVAMFVTLLAYTGVVITHHGWNLFPIFFGDMAEVAWPGQFNLDFMCMLALSALWVAWRHRFSVAGLLLAVVAFTGGTPFLSIYLLILSMQTNGDMREMLLGKVRV